MRNVIGCDSVGAVYRGRAGLTDVKERFAETTNPENIQGSASDALAGADVYLGLSQPGAVSVEGVKSMAKGAIVFAMANPTPEVSPEAIEGHVAVIATGRSDYPNQINNVLAFPGVFRGALDVRARTITESMEVAAGHAIAAAIGENELAADYIIPSVFNRDVVPCRRERRLACRRGRRRRARQPRARRISDRYLRSRASLRRRRQADGSCD